MTNENTIDVIIDGETIEARHHPLWRSLVLAAITRAIVCPTTGDVLDIRTAVILLDRDGDPTRAVSPAALDRYREHADDPAGVLAALARRGCQLATAPEGGW